MSFPNQWAGTARAVAATLRRSFQIMPGRSGWECRSGGCRP
jgi:hypothetical protein